MMIKLSIIGSVFFSTCYPVGKKGSSVICDSSSQQLKYERTRVACQKCNLAYLIKPFHWVSGGYPYVAYSSLRGKDKGVCTSRQIPLSSDQLYLPFRECQCLETTLRKLMLLPRCNNQYLNSKRGNYQCLQRYARIYLQSLRKVFTSAQPGRNAHPHCGTGHPPHAGLFREQPLRGAGRWAAPPNPALP